MTLEIAAGIVLGAATLTVLYGLCCLVVHVYDWVADEMYVRKRRRLKRKARVNA